MKLSRTLAGTIFDNLHGRTCQVILPKSVCTFSISLNKGEPLQMPFYQTSVLWTPPGGLHIYSEPFKAIILYLTQQALWHIRVSLHTNVQHIWTFDVEWPHTDILQTAWGQVPWIDSNERVLQVWSGWNFTRERVHCVPAQATIKGPCKGGQGFSSMVITPLDFRNIRKIRKNIQAVRNVRNIRKICQIIFSNK